ncbi:unnamed protein product [Dicrocoelium dendriticum]|nr:unnamed protein product [Dicrocoelium dendriticum]
MEAAHDGLFLNYNWNSDLLLTSQNEAGSATVSSRIFVGVDCFGRGCPGGGGWSTNVALQLILDAILRRPDRPLSVALFAPGWPFEKCDTSAANGDRYKEHQMIAENDDRFWSGLSDLLRRIRGSSQHCFVLDRISAPYIPVPFLKPTLHTTCGLLLKTTCSTGQGVFEPGAAFCSSMRGQELIPTALQLSEEILDTADSAHSTSSRTLKVTNYAYSRDTLTSNTCLLIECIGRTCRRHLIELFSFPPHTELSSRSAFTVAFSLPDYAPGGSPLNDHSFKDQLSSVALFLDYSLDAEDQGLLRHSIPSRQIVSARNVTVTGTATCPWMVMEFVVDHLATSHADHPIRLHRFGLVWECHFSPMQTNRFLLGCIQLCDPEFLGCILRKNTFPWPLRIQSVSITLFSHPCTHCNSVRCLSESSKEPLPYGRAATRIRFPVPEKPKRIRRGEGIGGGPEGRISHLRRCVSVLFDEERIELPWGVGMETRLYAERLIQEAVISSGEQDNLALLNLWLESPPDKVVKISDLSDEVNPSILELAVFWLRKPHLVEKLLKVFVPRYRLYDRAYTSIFRLPTPHYPSPQAARTEGFALLELHGNPWPPVCAASRCPDSEPFKSSYLINVLVDAARQSAAIAAERQSKLTST